MKDPVIVLQPGLLPFCYLLNSDLGRTALDWSFVDNVQQILPAVPVQSLAEDVFAGAISRESFYRRRPTGARISEPTALIVALLLRQSIRYRPDSRGKPDLPMASLTRGQRHLLLHLLRDYGVQCGDGSCCGIVRDPILPLGVAA